MEIIIIYTPKMLKYNFGSHLNLDFCIKINDTIQNNAAEIRELNLKYGAE